MHGPLPVHYVARFSDGEFRLASGQQPLDALNAFAGRQQKSGVTLIEWDTANFAHMLKLETPCVLRATLVCQV